MYQQYKMLNILKSDAKPIFFGNTRRGWAQGLNNIVFVSNLQNSEMFNFINVDLFMVCLDKT